jgi:hypothetical protein
MKFCKQGEKRMGLLDFENLGFSIDTLQMSTRDIGEAVCATMMSLPFHDGFAPNVNVMLQRFNGTLKDYERLNAMEMASMEMNVATNITNGILTFQYTMEKPYVGLLRCYCRAILKKKIIYLATGTSLVSQWSTVGSILEKCVNSLQIFDVEKPKAGKPRIAFKPT